jgi:hypothetical protein
VPETSSLRAAILSANSLTFTYLLRKIAFYYNVLKEKNNEPQRTFCSETILFAVSNLKLKILDQPKKL